MKRLPALPIIAPICGHRADRLQSLLRFQSFGPYFALTRTGAGAKRKKKAPRNTAPQSLHYVSNAGRIRNAYAE